MIFEQANNSATKKKPHIELTDDRKARNARHTGCRHEKQIMHAGNNDGRRRHVKCDERVRGSANARDANVERANVTLILIIRVRECGHRLQHDASSGIERDGRIHDQSRIALPRDETNRGAGSTCKTAAARTQATLELFKHTT